MENQTFRFGEEMTDEQVSLIFEETVRKHIETLKLPPFSADGLVLMRSEKEMLKCKAMKEQLKEKETKAEERKKAQREIIGEKSKKRREDIKKAKQAFKKQGKAKNRPIGKNRRNK